MEQTPLTCDIPFRISGSPPLHSLAENNEFFKQLLSEWLKTKTNNLKKIRRKIHSRVERIKNYEAHLAQNTFPVEAQIKLPHHQTYSKIPDETISQSFEAKDDLLLFQFKKAILTNRLEYLKTELKFWESQWTEQSAENHLQQELTEQFNGISLTHKYDIIAQLYLTLNQVQKEKKPPPNVSNNSMDITEEEDTALKKLQKEVTTLKQQFQKLSIQKNTTISSTKNTWSKHPNGSGPGEDHNKSSHGKRHNRSPSPQPRSYQTRGRKQTKVNQEEEKDVQDPANREQKKPKKQSSYKKH